MVRSWRTFSSRILNLLKGLRESNPRIYLNKAFKLDLQWWTNWCMTFNGLCLILEYNYGDTNYIVSDASLNRYGTTTYNANWLAGYFNTSSFPADVDLLIHSHHCCNTFLHHDNNINVLELVPNLLPARHFGCQWANAHIVCFSDNTQVVPTINKGVRLNKLSLSILTEILLLSVYYNLYLTA